MKKYVLGIAICIYCQQYFYSFSVKVHIFFNNQTKCVVFGVFLIYLHSKIFNI